MGFNKWQYIPDVMMVQAFLPSWWVTGGWAESPLPCGSVADNIIFLLRGVSEGGFQAVLLLSGYQNFNSFVDYLTTNHTDFEMRVDYNQKCRQGLWWLLENNWFCTCMKSFLDIMLYILLSFWWICCQQFYGSKVYTSQCQSSKTGKTWDSTSVTVSFGEVNCEDAEDAAARLEASSLGALEVEGQLPQYIYRRGDRVVGCNFWFAWNILDSSFGRWFFEVLHRSYSIWNCGSCGNCGTTLVWEASSCVIFSRSAF